MTTDRAYDTRSAGVAGPAASPAEREEELQAVIGDTAAIVARGVMGRVGELGGHYLEVRADLRELYRRRARGDARTDALIKAERDLDLLMLACGHELVAGAMEAVMPWLDVEEIAREHARDRRRRDHPSSPPDGAGAGPGEPVRP